MLLVCIVWVIFSVFKKGGWVIIWGWGDIVGCEGLRDNIKSSHLSTSARISKLSFSASKNLNLLQYLALAANISS